MAVGYPLFYQEGHDRAKKPKRQIAVGFLLPREMNGNAIYVVIKKDGGSVHAEAVSSHPFRAPNYPRGGVFITDNVSNFVGDSMGWYHLPVAIFLDGLTRENDAEVHERYKEDGLELITQLEKAREEIRLIGEAFSLKNI
jgi:hypothetical protein